MRLGRAFVALPLHALGSLVRQAAVLAMRFWKAVLRLSPGWSCLKRLVMSRARCSSTCLVCSFWSFYLFFLRWP